MPSLIMEKIEAFAKREEAPNPRCQQPDICQWSTGVVSCWKCNSAALGGKITDFGHGQVAGLGHVERTPGEAKVKAKRESTGKRNDPLEYGSEKWNMYANAIPKPVRAKLCVPGADLRALYKELRADGKEAFLKKHS